MNIDYTRGSTAKQALTWRGDARLGSAGQSWAGYGEAGQGKGFYLERLHEHPLHPRQHIQTDFDDWSTEGSHQVVRHI